MHEISLAQNIIDMVEQAAEREGFTRVSVLNLEIGVLSGVEVESLRFALERMMPSTCLRNAKIQIECPVGVAVCTGCGQTIHINHRLDKCSQCGSYHLQIVSGDAFRVVDLVVLDEDEGKAF